MATQASDPHGQHKAFILRKRTHGRKPKTSRKRHYMFLLPQQYPDALGQLVTNQPLHRHTVRRKRDGIKADAPLRFILHEYLAQQPNKNQVYRWRLNRGNPTSTNTLPQQPRPLATKYIYVPLSFFTDLGTRRCRQRARIVRVYRVGG